jgi:hypothetical protein
MATKNHTAAKARQSPKPSLQSIPLKAPPHGRRAATDWSNADACNEAVCEIDQAHGVVDTLIELAESGGV